MPKTPPIKNPPTKATVQAEYIRSAMRLPPDLHAEIKDAAKENGRTMNAEIIARLRASPLEAVVRQNKEIQKMLRMLLDRS